MFQEYLVLSLLVLVYMTFWFLVSVVKKRNDIADVAWGLGFLLIAVVSFYRGGIAWDRGFLVTFLVALWAFRLSFHIYLRNRGKKEDYRYKKWRESWGKYFFLRSFLQVYLLQGFLMLVIASPIIVVNIYRNGSFFWLDLLGLLVWAIGFFFETIGDWQLSRFIANPLNKGKIMQSGLWKYTRHPNYFGEVAQWWGLWIIALSVPFGYLSIIGPLVITILILKISGIPLLEKKMEENPEFQGYKKRVSVFFPAPPKK